MDVDAFMISAERRLILLERAVGMPQQPQALGAVVETGDAESRMSALSQRLDTFEQRINEISDGVLGEMRKLADHIDTILGDLKAASDNRDTAIQQHNDRLTVIERGKVYGSGTGGGHDPNAQDEAAKQHAEQAADPESPPKAHQPPRTAGEDQNN